MSDLIKEFYKNAGTLSVLLARKIACFERNPDIAQEFEGVSQSLCKPPN